MKESSTILRYLLHLRTSFGRKVSAQTTATDEQPLRSELFSAYQMEQHGRALADIHKLSRDHGPELLLTRLAENEGILLDARDLLTEAVKSNRRITPAGEWLLDNFYLIEEQIRTAKRHLPKGYSRELPRLQGGPSAGLPRVYDIALETISHGDGRVDPENLSGFVSSYQSVTSLKLGELWAIPIMLRLALIENLRRVAASIITDRLDRNSADYWADLMTETAEEDPKSLILVIADMARSGPPMVSSFVAELTRRLQGKGPALALPLTWIEQRLSESGLTIKQLVQSQNQQQAADQVSMSNSIGSLRFLGAMDWRAFVETMSIVELTLREDIGGVYGKMDFSTRDRYRHAVETIAKESRLSEGEVAAHAIRLARESAAGNAGEQVHCDHSSHVGYYLIDKGLARLEQAAEVRLAVFESFRKWASRSPLLMYMGAITLITAAITAGIILKAHAAGIHGWALSLTGFISILCASHLAVALVNWLATLMARPNPLPRLDFSKGIPPESRTMAVVPTMITSAQNIEDLVEALEVRFLANRDDNLHFGLLTDFRDADRETLPEDEPLLTLARKRIEELNEKYTALKGTTFYLFHRPRRWNPGDEIWMGYERKRGKLSDLNALLRAGLDGAERDRFSLVVGDTSVLSSVKYVITLDTDTQLPRDCAWQLVGAMAHPLNRARYDKDKQRVTEGYGILQPRVAVSLPGTNRSRYARLFGSEPGIDPYTRVVSDVYQDLFQEGSFIGKGIYDVDAFELALGGRFPENRILSHDLLEGCYARAGLMSDVMVYEEYPSSYSTDVSRRHRWIRGDWQLLRWLLPGVPGAHARFQRNPLSLLSRWKIMDNLRRSLVPVALTLLLLTGWTIMASPVFWTLAVLGIMLIPSLILSTLDLITKPGDVLINQHLAATGRSTGMRVAQAAFTLACLPYEALYSLDAIARTAWRMIFAHRRLLEWNASSNIRHTGLGTFIRSMWIAPAIAVAAAIQLALSRPGTLALAAPLLGLWFASPAIAWWISLPLARRKSRLTAEQTVYLRKVSRKTWAFFETFVGPDDNWLPPDNYQEHPVSIIAHRTSPTNMGLALLSNLSAHDFGYISTGQLIERTSNALHTMSALERYRGHFYNWYDTQSLKPLMPTYISSVDSGNLAGDLLTLRPGLLELPDQNILGAQAFDGLYDTFLILVDAAEGTAPAKLDRLRLAMEAARNSTPDTLMTARLCLERMASAAEELVAGLTATDKQALMWAQAFAAQCKAALDELALLTPWIMLADSPETIREFPALLEIPTLRQLAGLEQNSPSAQKLLVKEAAERAMLRISTIERLAREAGELSRMEYDFLFDKTRHLLSIGYNVGERRLDESYYDLLASEARLSCFVGIAQGQLPQESWFALGRLLTTTGGDPVLLSWSGSMFEYLMPLLVMPNYENTLLDQTCKAAVARQIEYGNKRRVPWGISESGFNTIDVHLSYQYRAFGVPGLGLKRGLAEDLVVAPYASALALTVSPEEACMNLQRLSAEGLETRYGFYEAIDYTPSRLQRGQQHAIIRSFMAHHQGMSLLSLAWLLLDGRMQKRFESDPELQATMLLLQERVPKATAFYSHTEEISEVRAASADTEMPVRVLGSPNTPVPEVQLLSNGRYHVMVTNAGGGYSRWKDIAVTRWREDTTCDNWGTFCYVKDVASGEFWSAAYQPTLKTPKKYEAIFSEARVEFRRTDNNIDMHTEITVSPEDDIELRRITITNRSRTAREIDVTSYAEVVLASPASDALHPAFSNLFVQTEIIRHQGAILCTRRPRSVEDRSPWMFHLVAVHGADAEEASYETDRLKFIGRGNTVADPQAMSDQATGNLSNSQGSVLDPIVAVRYRVTIEPEKSATVNIVTGIADNRDACMGLIEKYQDRLLADRVFNLAWTHSQVLLRQINATETEAQIYGRLASSVIYANSSMRAESGVIVSNRRGQSGLWGYSVSGDLPIVLLQIESSANIELVRQLVKAHAYWRLKGLEVDLVIWNEDHAGYRQILQEEILGIIAADLEVNVLDRPGGIFVRPADQISNEDRILFNTVARAIITDSRGTLVNQTIWPTNRNSEPGMPRLIPTRAYREESTNVATSPRGDLLFSNGIGGFTPDGREYVITTTHGQVTPAPWVNVLANPNFGSVISESGLAYTWIDNAHEFRLTPWHNDPVSDSSGEAFYMRDEESGHYWSPSPLPSRGAGHYASRHGFGYSVFEHTEDGIRIEMWVYVALDASVKFTALKVKNESGRSRRLSATGYVEWVLGDLRSKTAMHVITEIDLESGALFARNPYNTMFADRTAFFDVDESARTVSCDRTEFIGRNGTLQNPAAMTRSRLSGRVGAALDPCAAIQVPFELADGQEREVIFRLGAGRDANDTSGLVRRFRGAAAARKALESLWNHWNQTLGAVQVETPDRSVDIMANGWLVYQTLACRMWARSGYYQSGGAFGFRDQLQDMMALVHTKPGLVREHLLLAASRQFIEGDVQHWWHPPLGQGVRTHCSDDLLWLPLAASRYVASTGDTGVLDEPVRFLDSRQVNAGEDSYYDLPGQSEQTATLYEHCVRAITKGITHGEHGLPLIGTGDWNDGMNMVGAQGKGESVWLGFFLYDVLIEFAKIANMRGDRPFVERCNDEAAQLKVNIEKHGWDGGWYRRAYFDDGMPLGSAGNAECQIDSISQSWSVLSGAGDADRSATAMEAVDKRLVRREHGLIQLLDPPFDKSDLNPGYIKGYVPGVRENGGQYTHGAIWAAMAFARLGDGRRAWELLRMINPVNHAISLEDTETYKVEPYVVAADVYAVSPHIGRGGWTWYTGSAGWMYRLILESLLGLRLEKDKLRIAPCLPEDWETFKIHYRHRETIYHITVQVGGRKGVTVDGVVQPESVIPLVDDHREHWVDVRV